MNGWRSHLLLFSSFSLSIPSPLFLLASHTTCGEGLRGRNRGFPDGRGRMKRMRREGGKRVSSVSEKVVETDLLVDPDPSFPITFASPRNPLTSQRWPSVA